MAVLKSTTVNGSLTSTSTITATSDIITSGGLFKTTKNGNTVTIGSQNTGFCHIYNTANIPFIFNNSVATTAGNLGTIGYPWADAFFKGHLYNWYNGAAYGQWYVTATGTTSQIGNSQINLGNATAKGTANNAKGTLVLYGENAQWCYFRADNLTSSISCIAVVDRFEMSKLRITSTADVGGTTNSSPPFSIGDLNAGHLEFDNNEIIAKATATTSATLFLGDNTANSKVSIAAAAGLTVERGGTKVTGGVSIETGGLNVKSASISAGASNYNAGPTIFLVNKVNNVMLHTSTNGSAGVYHNATTGPAAKWLININSSGTVVANTSDQRFKIDKGYLNQDETYTILKETPIHNFIYKEDVENNNLEQSGIIAQELRDILLEHNYKNRNYLLLNKMDNKSLKIAGEEENTEEEEENIEEENNENNFKDPSPEYTSIYYDLTLPEKEYKYEANYQAFIPLLWKGWQINDERLRRIEQLLESGEL